MNRASIAIDALRIGGPAMWAVGSGGNGCLRGEDRLLGFIREHHAHDLLQREDVNASPPTVEVMAGAVPLAGVETDVMRVVVATECERDPVDRDPIELARVAI